MKAKGRPKKYTQAQRMTIGAEYYNSTLSIADIAAKYGISTATAARYISEFRKNHNDVINFEQTKPENIDEVAATAGSAVYFGDDQLPGQMSIYDYINDKQNDTINDTTNDTINSGNAGNAKAGPETSEKSGTRRIRQKVKTAADYKAEWDAKHSKIANN